MDNFITDESLEDTFAYLDNITICGHDQAHHDRNLESFLNAAKRRILTFNQEKCIFSTTTISILGSVVSNEDIKPDPERCRKVCSSSSGRSTAIPSETDASVFALSATLNQNSRPVAFFLRTLSGSELKHSSVEKEAAAIVEAVRKWRHCLTGKHFTLITDQKSVPYMFDTKRRSKIKNNKIMRWRLELSTYYFDIVYRAGEENVMYIRCISTRTEVQVL
ncbi:uncharacterized protein LOC114528328 [Dendronephthya gigantea]|uniref:uncharacterized protein LOC114528328 n=1 Tax=Dendronephthya gigantea TaxID=151771 RepID=UPI00106ADD63|nr:uncharacterized protein LOC114528328 [Dendronephthya gigantea]